MSISYLWVLNKNYSSPLRSENSDFFVKFKIVGEVKLGPFIEAETSDSSTLLERIIKGSHIGKRVYGMRGVLEVSALV